MCGEGGGGKGLWPGLRMARQAELGPSHLDIPSMNYENLPSQVQLASQFLSGAVADFHQLVRVLDYMQEV